MGEIVDGMLQDGLLDWPDPFAHDDDHGGRGGHASRPRCRYCGSTAVHWIHTGVRWRLFSTDAAKPHVCRRTASADEFPDLD